MPTTEQLKRLAEVAPAAYGAELETGAPATFTLGQWALESAWGADTPAGSNNPFGIKALEGQSYVVAQTKERDKKTGKRELKFAKFRVFDAVKEAFEAHGRLITQGKPYRAAFERYRESGDLYRYAHEIAADYATDAMDGADSTYANVVMQIATGAAVTSALARLRNPEQPEPLTPAA